MPPAPGHLSSAPDYCAPLWFEKTTGESRASADHTGGMREYDATQSPRLRQERPAYRSIWHSSCRASPRQHSMSSVSLYACPANALRQCHLAKCSMSGEKDRRKRNWFTPFFGPPGEGSPFMAGGHVQDVANDRPSWWTRGNTLTAAASSVFRDYQSSHQGDDVDDEYGF